MNTLKNKVLSVSLLAATSLWAVMPVASAQTVDQLQAQITALLAQIQALQAQVAGGSTASTPSTTSCTFTRDLTVGMKGDDVKCLQGYLQVSPQSGYFGSLTKAAVQKWQSTNGLPSTGYFGPMSRAKYSALVAVVTPTTPTTPTTPSTSTTTPTTPTTPTVSTPGVEAILTAEYAPQPGNNPTLYVGDKNVDVLGVRVKAKQGDALVQRLTLTAANSNVYTKVFSSLALYDGNTKLAEITNPASAYVKQTTGDYRITFSGFSVLVPKDGSKDLTVKGTLNSSIDSDYRISYTLSVPTDGVRAVDGAGVNQYASVTGSRSFTVEQSQSEQAYLSISKDASSPKSTVLVSDNDGKVEKGTMLVVAMRAEKGRVKVTDVIVTATGTATTSALSLYDGSNLLSSASVSGGQATFSDLSDVYIDKDQTKLFTIKADFTGAVSSTIATSSVSVATTGVTAEKDDGTSANVTGSTAQSDVMRVTALAPVLELVSSNLSYTAPTQGVSGTLSGSFKVKITAGGGDIYIPTTGAFTIVAATSTNATTSVNISYSQPSNTTVSGNYYKISKDQYATFDISVGQTSDNLPATDFYYLLMQNAKADRDGSGTADITVDWLDPTVWKTSAVFMQK